MTMRKIMAIVVISVLSVVALAAPVAADDDITRADVTVEICDIRVESHDIVGVPAFEYPGECFTTLSYTEYLRLARRSDSAAAYESFCDMLGLTYRSLANGLVQICDNI